MGNLILTVSRDQKTGEWHWCVAVEEEGYMHIVCLGKGVATDNEDLQRALERKQ